MRLEIIAVKTEMSAEELPPTPSEHELGDVAELMKALAELDVSKKVAMFVSLRSVFARRGAG